MLGFGLEALGIPTQIASTAGGTLTALCAATEELREARAEPQRDRVARLVKGNVYRNPVLMLFYMVLAVFPVTNAVLLVPSIAIGSFLGLTGLSQEYAWEVWEPYVYESAVLSILVLLPLYVALIAKSVAHRIRDHGLVWICAAVVASWLVGTAIQRLWDLAPLPERGGLSSSWEVTLDFGSLFLGMLGATVGYVWARRTQQAFVMRKLFRQLSRSDQNDVIDLVQTLPTASVASHTADD